MRRTRESNKKVAKNGYTLLELLVVLAILSMLALVAVPQVLSYLDRAKGDTAKNQINSLMTVLDLYRLDTGSFPDTAEGLQALLNAPPNTPGWHGPYLRKPEMLNDPWGRAFEYSFPGSHGELDIVSLGADGAPGGEGTDTDLTSW